MKSTRAILNSRFSFFFCWFIWNTHRKMLPVFFSACILLFFVPHNQILSRKCTQRYTHKLTEWSALQCLMYVSIFFFITSSFFFILFNLLSKHVAQSRFSSNTFHNCIMILTIKTFLSNFSRVKINRFFFKLKCPCLFETSEIWVFFCS